MIVQPVLTPEQAALFRELVRLKPEAAWVNWESGDIDVIDGQRVLCLQAPWQDGQREPIYYHYAPAGVTDEQARRLSARHGLAEVTYPGG